MPNKLKSTAITQGVQRAPNRAMLRAVGLRRRRFREADRRHRQRATAPSRPAMPASTCWPGGRRRPCATAGGMPQTFGTITVSDGISMGTEGMKYSLVSREVIADSIETACGAQSMDGVLAVGGCDKNMPGAMIAIARMNIPGDLRLRRHHQAGALRRPGSHGGERLRGGRPAQRRQDRRPGAAGGRAPRLPRARAPAAGCSPPTPCRRCSRPWG